MERVDLLVVGIFHRLQGVVGMARLATRLAGAFLAQIAHGGFFVTIARRRLAAVGAVEGQTPFQLAVLGEQGGHKHFAFHKELHDRRRLDADLPQKLLASGQLAHKRARKSLRRG